MQAKKHTQKIFPVVITDTETLFFHRDENNFPSNLSLNYIGAAYFVEWKDFCWFEVLVNRISGEEITFLTEKELFKLLLP